MIAPSTATAASTGPAASSDPTKSPARSSSAGPNNNSAAIATSPMPKRPATSITIRRRATRSSTSKAKARSRGGASVVFHSSARRCSASLIWASESRKQFSASAFHVRLDRPERLAERLGRFGMREPAAQAQRHRRPLVVRQQPERGGKV